MSWFRRRSNTASCSVLEHSKHYLELLEAERADAEKKQAELETSLAEAREKFAALPAFGTEACPKCECRQLARTYSSLFSIWPTAVAEKLGVNHYQTEETMRVTCQVCLYEFHEHTADYEVTR